MEVAAKFYDPDPEALDDQESEESLKSDTTEASEVPQSTGSGLRLPNDDKEYSFRCEIETYKRLSNTSICPRFYGALQGAGLGGFQAGIILMEKLPVLFDAPGEMTEQERQTAYDHVLKLHRRGIHHGNVVARNFGRREVVTANAGSKRKRSKSRVEDNRSAVVICDFSHSDVFEACDPEQCRELQRARQELLEGGTDT
ncbi:hypothetical protein PHISP_02397 [Aspergillus sp. HF37]|nr:hypothetical protein PHISP_02397 [Aspergillus sp. HF37]